MAGNTNTFHPVINGLQKMALYTTRSRCYLIGCNNVQTKFRVLKIDRTEAHDLVLTDDNVEYSQSEIKELLMMIGGGNKIALRSNSTNTKPSNGVSRTVSAFGIFGFIRFMEGYYLILITKRRKVAVIGYHSIYKVEDTSVTYIPHESIRKVHDHEQRYVKLLGNIDLTSNFYFSYTYDMTNSLQFNMSPVSNVESAETESDESFMNWPFFPEKKKEGEEETENGENEESHYGHRTEPSKKFVWNSFLLEPLIRSNVHPCWVIPITQGFVAQSNISVYGRPFFLTLIARRSSCYAGTRFLKRGANCDGEVANEVETEQIVHDAHSSSLERGRFTSFVQIRGSIPCHWSQDISKMVPKPPITIDVCDPYAETAGNHFDVLFRRFGSPIIALNLVKKREKKRHESILNEEYRRLIQQLNVTLPPSFRIQHVAVDMARINKDKKENVMNRLQEIALESIKKTGIFQSFPPYYTQAQDDKTSTQKDKNEDSEYAKWRDKVCVQRGVVRVNCVDCLDRTNTAQFCLGKCALAFQLYRLGVLEKPFIEFDSACIRILEEMYEDHGDTLALQYGGSQLVHRIATYRKTAPWSSHGNDIMQSLSRYLSNTFSDQEKQQAINLFLGVFEPLKQRHPIWELASDYQLHHPLSSGPWPCHKKSSSQWWDSDVMSCLPFACDQVKKEAIFLTSLNRMDPRIDLYGDFYHPYEFCVMSEFFTYHMNHSSSYMHGNDFTQVALDESPFSVRWLRTRPKELECPVPKEGAKGTGKKFSIFSSFTSSPAASTAPSSESSSSESDPTEDETTSSEMEAKPEAKDEISSTLSFQQFFSPPEYTYGSIANQISAQDDENYTRYTFIWDQISMDEKDRSGGLNPVSKDELKFEPLVASACDDAFSVRTPFVSDFNVKTYASYVHFCSNGPGPPKHKDILKYQQFASVA